MKFLIPLHNMFALQVPHVVRLKTLICKAVGVLFSVAGGMETENVNLSLTNRWFSTEDIHKTAHFCYY